MLSRSHVEAAMVVALAACGPRSPGPQAASPLLTVDACRDVALLIPDHRCYAAAVPQTARRGFVDFHVQREGFAPGHYTRVEHHLGGPGVLNRSQSGCMGRAVAPDGTLCPSLVLPGAPVERDVAERIVELLEAKPEGPARAISCEGPSDHHLVFYGEDGQPVGEVTFNLGDCPDWVAWPGAHGHVVETSGRDALKTLCQRQGWSRCGEPVSRVDFEAEDFFGLHGTAVSRRRTTAPATDASRTVSDTTAAERRELCVWNAVHVITTWPPGRRIGLSRDADPGVTFVGTPLDWKACIDDFPHCEHRVGEVLPCMEIAQRGDPWFMLDAHAHCRTLASCIWGFEALQLPNDQAKAYLDAG